MIAGHMDEIGIMVTHIDKKGFLRFTPIGGLYPHTLFGGRVRFMNGTIGVIGMEDIKDFKKVAPLEKMYIDVGATSPQDCPVRVGDAAGFVRDFVDQGNVLISKAMDDRIAAAIMIQALKEVKDSPNEIYFVFTTQEEVGTRGAGTSAYSINPDLGIAIDVTDTGDTPNCPVMDVKMGKGPAIKVKDHSVIVDKRVVNWMIQSAEKLQMSYQLEVLAFGGTDAGAINRTRAGVPSGCISIPTRYIHTPSEMVSYPDVLDCVRLLADLVNSPVDLQEL